MHLYSKSAEAVCLDVSSPFHERNKDASLNEGDSLHEKNATKEDKVCMDGSLFEGARLESTEVKPKQHLASTFRFYNLVKTCAKDDAVVGIKNLTAYVSKAMSEINNKNSKGSTGLHACGYLKRWDLAQVLLDAGADPLSKNLAGHCFFLNAMRDVSAPWEVLLRCHPELYERHRNFLAQVATRPRVSSNKRNNPDCEKIPSSERDGRVDSSVSTELKKSASSFDLSLTQAIDSNKWEQVEDLLSESVSNLSSYRMAANRALEIAKNAPQQVLKMLYKASLGFSLESVIIVVDRGIHEGWEDFWMQWGKSLPSAIQEELLNTVLREKKTQLILPMAQQGWIFGEDFIESCEEAGYLDIADKLIDLQELRKERSPLKALKAPSVGKKIVTDKSKNRSGSPLPRTNKSHAKGSSNPKHSRSAGGGSRQSKQANARRSAMIANLDGPVREANEFEYKDKKPPSATTIIIIKKARVSLGEP